MNTENGQIIALLARKSHFTPKQVSALETYRTRVHLKVSDNRTRALNGKIIRKGTYYRILQQARTNAIKSLFTMILLHHLDVIDDLTWERISQLSAVIRSSSQDAILDESTTKKIISEVEQAFEKILAIKTEV